MELSAGKTGVKVEVRIVGPIKKGNLTTYQAMLGDVEMARATVANFGRGRSVSYRVVDHAGVVVAENTTFTVKRARIGAKRALIVFARRALSIAAEKSRALEG